MSQQFSLNAVSKSAAIDVTDCNRVSLMLVTADAGTGLTGSIEVSNLDLPVAGTATDWATFTGGSALSVTGAGQVVQLPPAKWARFNLTARTSGTCRGDWFLQRDQTTSQATGR